MDEPEKANDGLSSGALFSGTAGDSMQQVVLCSNWCTLAVLPNPSTPTSGHVIVFIRVPESRLRGNSPERFGRGERLKSPTYPYCAWVTKTRPLTLRTTSPDTDFTHDVCRRYICNGLDEAQNSTPTPLKVGKQPDPNARRYDIVVLGSSTFGSLIVDQLFAFDEADSHRILILKAGALKLRAYLLGSCHTRIELHAAKRSDQN